MIQKNIYIIVCLIIVILLSVYFFINSGIREPYKPYHADYTKNAMNPPPKNSTATMPDPGTFKLMDVTTSTYFNFDRSQNLAIMNPSDGVQLYIDSSSNVISNKISGAVGVVDYVNNNYVENVSGRIEVSDKILNTPGASYVVDGPRYGSIKNSWIFCMTATPFVYNIYNSGGWLNVVNDSDNKPHPYITNTRREWMVIGDAQQINNCAVADYFSVRDPISKQYLFVDPNTSLCTLSDRSSNFVINDVIQSVFYKKNGSYLFQDMYNGDCIVPSDGHIIGERFVMGNPKLGWRIFKTNQADQFILYNKDTGGWLYTDGRSVSLGKTPVSWILSESVLNYFLVEETPFLIQDDLTKKYMFIGLHTDTPILSDKASYFTTKFVNGKDDQGGIYIMDIEQGKFLVDADKRLQAKIFNPEIKNLFFWSFIPTNGNQYNIFKIVGSTQKNDPTNALFVDYVTESDYLSVSLNTAGTYRTWNLIYPNNTNTKMKESFIGSIQEGLSTPQGPMSAMSSAMSAANNSGTNQSNQASISQIPQSPNLSSMTDLTSQMANVPGMPEELIQSVQKMNLPQMNGDTMNAKLQETIDGAMQALQDQFPNSGKNKGISVFTKHGDINDPLRAFKTPHQMHISAKGDPKQNINAVNQYDNALNNGVMIDGSGKPINQPLGSRYFVNTNTICHKKDGRGTTNRYMLVDNMKYMKYEDGSVNTDNYGLLYSAMGSLQELDSNNLLSQLGQIENPDDPNNKCVNVTIDLKGDQKTFDSKFVTVGDCKKIDAVAFKDKNAGVCEAFSEYVDIDNIYVNDNNKEVAWKPEDIVPRAVVVDDSITTFYLGSLTVVGLFILYRLMEKK